MLHLSKFPLNSHHLARRLPRSTVVLCQKHSKSSKPSSFNPDVVHPKSSKPSTFDPDVLLKNIVAIRTKGWSSAFNLFGEASAKDRADAEDAYQHAQMSPAELVPPSTDIVDSHPRKQRKALIKQAMHDGNLSFGFSAGVLYELHELGIVNSNTKLGGASAGSIIAACYHSGLTRDVVVERCLKLAHDCRSKGTRGRLGLVLRAMLEEALPSDCHERCHETVHIAVTQAFPSPRSLLVSSFHNKEDLVSAVLTSCHIPWWFDTRLFTTFRGRYCYDGGLTNFIPVPANTEGVRVCCFPAGQLSTISGIAISPDAYHDWPHDLNQMLQWAFEPPTEDLTHTLITAGAKDARAWALDHHLLGVGGGREKGRNGVLASPS